MAEEITLHEFEVGSVTVPPGGKVMYLCDCKLTSKRLLITDRKGDIYQVRLDEIVGVRVQGYLMKCVIVQLRDWGLNMDCKKQSPQVAAWIREAVTGA